MTLVRGLTKDHLEIAGAGINVAHAGSGPPVLLLHGYPETHGMWRHIAPILAQEHTVVCPDLRGYGDSDTPPGGDDHIGYSKRAMAHDQVEVMRTLGFDRFAVAGHDRGARVALRMTLDHPETVTQLAILDIVPTAEIYATIDQRRAMSVWRYFFLVQPFDLPERLIGRDPGFYLRWTLDEWSATPEAFPDEVLTEYERCFDPATIHATCEDYRAGATIDLEHDVADCDVPLRCPVLVLWSERGLGSDYDVAGIWRSRAPDVTGHGMDCGHFLAEERPEETATALRRFLR
ncbi:MAG TPA: alpha/beta hydrolase [Acidimicrobiales bacterium]|jgi:haloacetate dehalogenase|nr:alpha/beta hydrolase [Acidimicrobiales bacterium]